MKRTALYGRVSGEQQEREETIDSQLAQLRQLALDKGLTVLERHTYLDEGYSGDLLARPGLDRLRDDARDGLIDTVLVHCPDRLARRYAYQVVVIEELQRHGCEVDFVNREIARTPEDQMLLAMQGVIAEYERAKIMERTRRGRLHKLQTGVLIAPHPPLGYRWVPRQGAEPGRVEVVPEQAELVRQIFRWVADEGLSLFSVVSRLKQRGIPAPKGGQRWPLSTVHLMLRNRAYVGEFCMNRIMAVEPEHPPKPGVYRRHRKCAQRIRPADEWIVVPGPAIIERDLFERVQKRLSDNRRYALRHAHPDNQLLLRCLLRCGCCGYAITGTVTHARDPRTYSHGYYTCIKHDKPARFGDGLKCSLNPIKAEVIDEVVWSDLCNLMSDSTRIARYAGLDGKATRKPLQTEVERLHRELRACERQLQRLLDAYQHGAMEMGDLQARRKQLDTRKTLLTDALKQAERALADEDVRRSLCARLPELVRRVKNGLANADFATRLRLVRLLIDRVVVHPNLDLEIHYVLPGAGRLPGGFSQAGKPLPEGQPPVPDGVVSGKLGLHSQRQIALRPEKRADGSEQASQQSHYGLGEVTSPARDPQESRCGWVLGRNRCLTRAGCAPEPIPSCRTPSGFAGCQVDKVQRAALAAPLGFEQSLVGVVEQGAAQLGWSAGAFDGGHAGTRTP
jgi:site-specific DNA recombinase